MRKILAVDCEGGVALLIVDVKINGIGRNLFLPQRLDDLSSPRFGVITVAALLVAERPERRKRRAANQRGELLHDFLGLRASDKVIVQLAALCSKGKITGRLLSEVEAAAISVVEKNAICRAFQKAHEKRNGLIERIIRFLPAEKVGVPHRIRVITAVHRTGLIAQAKVILLRRHSLPGVDVCAVPSHGQGRLIRKENVARQVRESDQQGRFLDDDNDAARSHA